MAALAADPDVGARSGGLFLSWGPAKEYGFTDVDGRRSDWGSFSPGKVREIVERDMPPSEEDMDLFVVRTRLHQVEDDPAAADEAARLWAYLDGNRRTCRLGRHKSGTGRFVGECPTGGRPGAVANDRDAGHGTLGVTPSH